MRMRRAPPGAAHWVLSFSTHLELVEIPAEHMHCYVTGWPTGPESDFTLLKKPKVIKNNLELFISYDAPWWCQDRSSESHTCPCWRTIPLHSSSCANHSPLHFWCQPEESIHGSSHHRSNGDAPPWANHKWSCPQSAMDNPISSTREPLGASAELLPPGGLGMIGCWRLRRTGPS